MNGLFCGGLPSKCSKLYESLHESKGDRFDACFASAREHCEDMWSEFCELADPNFKREFAARTHERWFEMYLTVSLIRAGYEVKCPKPGPDVLLHAGGQRIWIEAVCASSGALGRPDSVPRMEPGQVRPEPTREYVLRVRNALETKQEKYRKYIEKGTVSNDDVTVVAVNVNNIDGLGPHINDHIKRSLYGLGDPIVLLDQRRRPIGIEHDRIESVRKSSGADVGLLPFIDNSTAHVSALLASHANMINRPDMLGDDFVLYPNVSCRTPWPQGILNLGREWRFSPQPDGWQGTLVRAR